jgi:hypothetical protein
MNEEKVTYTRLADFAAWEVEAYQEGVEIPQLAQFLAEHPAEAAAWQREQQTLTQLQTALYRFDCPSPAALQDYHWQQLSPAEQEKVQAHLPLCPHCREELRQLRAFLTPAQPVAARPTAVEAASHWWTELQGAVDRLRLVVADLLTPPTPQLAGIALRSDSDPATHAAPQSLFFEAGEAAISLLIQKEVTGALLLSGQILMVNPNSQGSVKLIPQAPEPPPSTVQADVTGNFAFSQLHPGSYQLQITLADQLIVIPVFNI